MDLQKMFHPESCKANILDSSKDAVLETLADLALKHPAASNVDRGVLLKRLHDREEKGSTGIGSQLAIPHAEVPGLEHFVIALATSQKGVDYESIDGKKARLFFMILAPLGEAASHLMVLANISRTLSHPGVRPEILAAPTELALYEAFISKVNTEGSAALKKKEEMSLLTLVLFDKDLIYDILEKGIEGANITESFGMGEFISNVPLFAGFLGFMNDRTNRSQTLQALIPTSAIDSIVEGIESITGDLDKKQGAALFISPLQLWKGTMKMM
jgi:PTS system nitrogen regulatory IIA component